mmetsp:Transcript_31962/g.95716  ORF Transcript_31962/g.95716 Transcript_31962/m.95716 type:complete len:210 (+) Transcript_31962:1798-2427(+)
MTYAGEESFLAPFVDRIRRLLRVRCTVGSRRTRRIASDAYAPHAFAAAAPRFFRQRPEIRTPYPSSVRAYAVVVAAPTTAVIEPDQRDSGQARRLSNLGGDCSAHVESNSESNPRIPRHQPRQGSRECLVVIEGYVAKRTPQGAPLGGETNDDLVLSGSMGRGCDDTILPLMSYFGGNQGYSTQGRVGGNRLPAAIVSYCNVGDWYGSH